MKKKRKENFFQKKSCDIEDNPLHFNCIFSFNSKCKISGSKNMERVNKDVAST